MRSWLLVPLVAVACSSNPSVMPDAGPPPMPMTVGMNIDDSLPRTLTTNCPLPQAFYDGMTASNVTSGQLTVPDFGLTFNNDPNRMHWTDDVRHQADLAPQLACMVENDVE